jgi:hypothetical protein
MFWFNGDTRTSVTVRWGDTLEIPVKIEYGSDSTRIEAEFEDDGTGYAHIVLNVVSPDRPNLIRYRNLANGTVELVDDTQR